MLDHMGFVVYRLDCHVLIVMEKLERRTAEQQERKDAERQWTPAAVHRQVASD